MIERADYFGLPRARCDKALRMVVAAARRCPQQAGHLVGMGGSIGHALRFA